MWQLNMCAFLFLSVFAEYFFSKLWLLRYVHGKVVLNLREDCR